MMPHENQNGTAFSSDSLISGIPRRNFFDQRPGAGTVAATEQAEVALLGHCKAADGGTRSRKQTMVERRRSNPDVARF